MITITDLMINGYRLQVSVEAPWGGEHKTLRSFHVWLRYEGRTLVDGFIGCSPFVFDGEHYSDYLDQRLILGVKTLVKNVSVLLAADQLARSVKMIKRSIDEYEKSKK